MNPRNDSRDAPRHFRTNDRPQGMAPGEDEDLSGEIPAGRWPSRIKQAIIGRARNPFDSQIFHKISLIAFFAWVGV